jgi:hypothetical protein
VDGVWWYFTEGSMQFGMGFVPLLLGDAGFLEGLLAVLVEGLG